MATLVGPTSTASTAPIGSFQQKEFMSGAPMATQTFITQKTTGASYIDYVPTGLRSWAIDAHKFVEPLSRRVSTCARLTEMLANVMWFLAAVLITIGAIMMIRSTLDDELALASGILFTIGFSFFTLGAILRTCADCGKVINSRNRAKRIPQPLQNQAIGPMYDTLRNMPLMVLADLGYTVAGIFYIIGSAFFIAFPSVELVALRNSFLNWIVAAAFLFTAGILHLLSEQINIYYTEEVTLKHRPQVFKQWLNLLSGFITFMDVALITVGSIVLYFSDPSYLDFGWILWSIGFIGLGLNMLLKTIANCLPGRRKAPIGQVPAPLGHTQFISNTYAAQQPMMMGQAFPGQQYGYVQQPMAAQTVPFTSA